VRFQVQYPTPLASIAGTIVPDDQEAVAASYERALFADLDALLHRLPHDRCAVQWDVAVEFGLLEGAMGPGSAVPIDQITPALVRCVDQVPADVPVGLHLCYGDYGHQHFKQPDSVQLQVDLVNAVVAAAHRPVNWASFTVPQARRDADYFAPLHDLAAGPETELYFALVPYHPDDQPDGTTTDQLRHIDAALRLSSAGPREWGICTECGMGRVERSEVPKLLDLHSEILGL
jgi:methionine synthase II (cobalamin-independent)